MGKSVKLGEKDLILLRKTCLAVAAADTSCWPDEYDREISPLHGHCAAVASTIQGILGGCIVSGRVQGVTHYWNRLANGKEYDLTSCQFGGDGYTPLKKGRKVSKPKVTHPRFLLFAKRLSDKLKEKKQGLDLICDEVTSAWSALNCAWGVLHSLMEKNWLTEDKEKSKEYFPKGGLDLVVKELREVSGHLTNCLIEEDKLRGRT